MSFNEVGIEIIWKGKGINEIGLNKNGNTCKDRSKIFQATSSSKLIGDSSKAKKS